MNRIRSRLAASALALPAFLVFFATCAKVPARPSPAEIGKRSGGAETQEIAITAGGQLYRFDPATWALSVAPAGSTKAIPVSASVRSRGPYLREGPGRFAYPELGISVSLEPDGDSLSLAWSATRKAVLSWPRIEVPESGFLILPKGEGSYIPARDSAFKAYLSSRAMDTLEDLDMPFWGIERDDRILSYLLDNPFRNSISFKPGSGISMGLTHDFPALDSWRQPLVFRVFVDGSGSKTVPAARFRDAQMKEGKIRSLSDKMSEAPRIGRLVGAPHAYLWSEGPICEGDILPGARRQAASLILGELGARGSSAEIIGRALTADDVEDLRRIAAAESAQEYLRLREAMILSKVYAADPRFVLGRLASCLAPRADWGGGISRPMIDRLRRAGFKKFLLIDATDWGAREPNPELASYAEEGGFLFGVYDSYDSVHDPRTAGTDESWPTAQFDEAAYRRGRMLDSSGRFIEGFKGLGYWFSPVAAEPYMRQRVRRNFDRVAYSYYYLDCDAFGQYYDDYTPGRMASQAEDARAREERIGWVASSFKVPVGSEGSSYLMAGSMTVAEGVNMPVVGWGDPELHTPGSKYFLGKPWPSSGPEMFFKTVPLPERYNRLYVDPRFRLPLYQAAYHDCLITTPHWASASRKFTTTRKIQAMIEILYQAAPLYHLNAGTSDAELAAILRQARLFGSTHEYSFRYPAEGFECLDSERLVQRVRYGGMLVTANFGSRAFAVGEARIPARALRIEWPDGRVTEYSPDE